MKHEYITCDRCGKKISKKLPMFNSWAKLTVNYSNPYSLNLEAEMLRLKQTIEKMSFDYNVELDIAFELTNKNFDLCHKCRKELMLFLEKKEEAEC